MNRSGGLDADRRLPAADGEKFIFDVGTGSFTTLYSLGVPLDTRSLAMNVHEYDWPIPNNVICMVWNIGGERYVTPEWILQGYEWQTLELMDEFHEEFNEEYGTDFKFPLRPKEENARKLNYVDETPGKLPGVFICDHRTRIDNFQKSS